MCNSRKAFENQYFGYQVENSGYLDRYTSAGSIYGRANFTPVNPLRFDSEPGFVGAAYTSLDVRAVAPLFAGARYGGLLPLGQQPKVDLPDPYERRVVV